MDASIVSIEAIRAKAQFAFRHGRGRDDHGFNWHAPAIAAWQQAWDECAAEVHGFELPAGRGNS